MTRSQVEDLLETALGKPSRNLRDIHTELVLADHQRAVLHRLLKAGPDCLFPMEDVELMFDALEEFGDCTLADILGTDWLAADAAPPPLTSEELRVVVDLCAAEATMSFERLLAIVEAGLIAEQTRLRRALVSWQDPPESDLPAEPLAAGVPASR